MSTILSFQTHSSFFGIFFQESKNDIRKYVATALSDGTAQYTKHRIDLESPTDIDKDIVDDIKSTFLEYYLKVQYKIAQEIYAFNDYEEFLLYMAKNAQKRVPTDIDEDSIEDDVFTENEDRIPFDEEYRELVLNVLKDKLPDALKERK